MRPREVTSGHHLGFLYWFLAGEGDGTVSTQELGEVARALARWLGPQRDPEEVVAVAQESLDWYLAIRGSTEALEREIEWILDVLRQQDWFDADFKLRIHADLARIALADGQVSGVEAFLVRRILQELEAPVADEPRTEPAEDPDRPGVGGGGDRRGPGSRARGSGG